MCLMKERLSRQWKDILFLMVLAAFATVFFCACYGYRVLKPWYTDWMYNDGDINQHFFGWLGYRAGGWTFPIGNTDILSYPSYSSIVYTDSIPLYAVLFKLLSPLLPQTFQYFGLWGLMCFVLQAWLGSAIAGRFSKSYLFRGIGGMFFLATPVLIQRMFVHTALAGHFVILMALYVFVSYGREKHKYQPLILFSVIGFLCAGIHVYLLLMCGIILAAYILLDLIRTRRVVRPVLMLVSYIAAALLNLWLLGALTSGDGSSSTGGLGEFGFNLNSFFNPLYHSSLFFDELSIYNRNAENYAYLGLGLLLLLLFALITTAVFFFARGEHRKHVPEIISVAVLFAVTAVIAASPVVACGDKLLFTYKIPSFVGKVWSIFRSSGRIIWVDIYLLLAWGLYAASRYTPKKAGAVLILICLAVQIADISPLMRDKYEEFFPIVRKANLMENEIWHEALSDPDIKHIYITYECEPYSIHRFAMTDMALSSGRTVNQFLIARNEFTMEELHEDMFPIREDTLYVFTDQTLPWAEGTGLKIIETGDGFRLGYMGSNALFDTAQAEISVS